MPDAITTRQWRPTWFWRSYWKRNCHCCPRHLHFPDSVRAERKRKMLGHHHTTSLPDITSMCVCMMGHHLVLQTAAVVGGASHSGGRVSLGFGKGEGTERHLSPLSVFLSALPSFFLSIGHPFVLSLQYKRVIDTELRCHSWRLPVLTPCCCFGWYTLGWGGNSANNQNVQKQIFYPRAIYVDVNIGLWSRLN